MANQTLTEVKINGVNLGSYLLDWMVKEKFGETINTCQIKISMGVYNILSITPGQAITIKNASRLA